MKIRPMTPRDYAAVMQLWRSTPGLGLHATDDSRAGILRYLRRNPGLSFVACDGVRLVGAVLSGHDGRRGTLHHLAVAQSHRKQGIGQALVARCRRALARQQIPKCNIFVYRANVSGQAFWMHTGWQERTDLSLLQQWTGPRPSRKLRAC
ncbi:MAG: GNAT family N-acetyltransferase [Verrucomicrobia bacterium]|nr:MAG: GNAT family N-acetyltransferase [Verrucomicrobiota bacterium]